MPKVQKLPESLIRLIAAGEVVERPASVLKELVENSLDAGARKIAIDLWGAGRSRIRVTDDGEGMTREDAEAALDRHATSKLKTFDDLYNLSTFGFRGEALPSIAAVSRLELTTRPQAQPTAWRLTLEGGRLLSSEAAGAPLGTTIDVQDLFFNTPARSKFLKRDSTERTRLLKTIQEITLARPDVRFEVCMDGKNLYTFSTAKNLGERVADVWGLSATENLVPIDVAQGPCTIRGFVNAIPAHHPTKALQLLYVNQRPVQQRLLTHAVYEAYKEWLPVGRHPIFLLFITLDPKLVDVNVHPTKREVRFSDERAIYDLLFRKIRELFSLTPTEAPSHHSAESTGTFPPKPHGFPMDALARYAPPMPVRREASQAALAVQLPFTGTNLADRVADSSTPAHGLFTTDGLRLLGVFRKLYIAAEQGEDLLLIDQHAAAERVLFERLLAQSSTQGAPRQALLTPLLWEISVARAEVVKAYLPNLQELGFSLEPFGPSTFALKEWPAVLPQSKQAERFLEELLDAFEEERPTDKTVIQHQIAARAACRSAIMAGDPIAPAEIDRLLADLAACERPMTCPHGRPTHLRFSSTDLDRQFKRI
uniref:DNA mismatch repair protein MutL n=1 Tax=uncultured bacterium CSLF42 TaxID=1091574 RepID=G4WVZ2_9BACT|nr:DNA mismatch repair enzyme [uncultured bacterium CSLF42]